MGATFTNQDRLDGAAGNDTLTLDGDYSAGVAIAAATIHNIETIQLAGGESYKLTTNEGNVAAGQTLTVNGADLGAGDKLTFNGTHETNGHFNLHGGAGADILTGGTQSSSFTGGGGIDSLTGGAGADTFVYGAVSDSTSTAHDNITGFDALNDKIDISALGFALAGVDAAITSGKLTSNFDSTLASAVNASKLDPHHAVLFSPTVGGYVGHTFLVIDVNGTAGYQASQDLVIEISSGAHLTSFGSANIVG
jgi:Ca2+-binding RTX toxin-like protein